jgi:hypothetical protein
VYFIHGLVDRPDLTDSLSEAFRDGIRHVEYRLWRESSAKLFAGLQQLIDDLKSKTVLTTEISMTRNNWLILRSTAKEFTMTPEELLVLCLAQYVSGC